MKRYIKATTGKPVLDNIQTEWTDIDNGIKFTVYSSDGDVLFEEVFDFNDVDPDAVYDSAADMAALVLSQTYDLSDNVQQALNPDNF